MFNDKGCSFCGLKHLMEKMTAVASLTRVRVVTTPLQRTTKLKISYNHE